MLNLKIIFVLLVILKISISCEGDSELKKSDDFIYQEISVNELIKKYKNENLKAVDVIKEYITI